MFHLFAGLLELGVDARLFLDQRTLALSTSLRDEKLIRDSRVSVGNWVSASMLKPGLAGPIQRAFLDAEFGIVTDLGPIFASKSTRPFFFMPTGGDLTVVPFPIASRERRRRGRSDMSALVVGGMQRRAIRRAREIWCAPFQPNREALKRILGPKWMSHTYFMPQPLDTTLFSPDSTAETVEFRSRTGSGDSFLIFHPSRVMMKHTRFLQRSGQWKGNSLLLEGMNIGLKRGVDLRLMIPRQKDSPDLEAFTERATELDLRDRIIWLDPSPDHSFSWQQIARMYPSCNVAVDEFGAGWFGQVTLEAASCGVPTASHFDLGVIDQLYPEHPFVDVGTATGFADYVQLLSKHPPEAEDLRSWAVRNHDRVRVAQRALSRAQHALGNAM